MRKTVRRNFSSTDLSLTERAYRALKEEILSVRLPPGAPLPIERLVHEMQISRTPLREAIQRLEQEGLLEIRPRLGTFVAPLDLRKIREMYYVRGALEGAAARTTAALADPAHLAAIARQLHQYPVDGAVDLRGMSESGHRLHRLISEECGNETLAGMIRQLQDHFVRFRNLSLQLPEKVLASHRQHLEILAALEARDGDRAERLMREHLEQAGRFLVESLLNPRSGAPPLVVTVPPANAVAGGLEADRREAGEIPLRTSGGRGR